MGGGSKSYNRAWERGDYINIVLYVHVYTGVPVKSLLLRWPGEIDCIIFYYVHIKLYRKVFLNIQDSYEEMYYSFKAYWLICSPRLPVMPYTIAVMLAVTLVLEVFFFWNFLSLLKTATTTTGNKSEKLQDPNTTSS